MQLAKRAQSYGEELHDSRFKHANMSIARGNNFRPPTHLPPLSVVCDSPNTVDVAEMRGQRSVSIACDIIGYPPSTWFLSYVASASLPSRRTCFSKPTVWCVHAEHSVALFFLFLFSQNTKYRRGLPCLSRASSLRFENQYREFDDGSQDAQNRQVPFPPRLVQDRYMHAILVYAAYFTTLTEVRQSKRER